MLIDCACPFDMRGGSLFAGTLVQEVRVGVVRYERGSCACGSTRNVVVVFLTWWHILTHYA